MRINISRCWPKFIKPMYGECNEIVVSSNNMYEYAAGESSAFWHADCRFSFTSVLFDVPGHKIRENPGCPSGLPPSPPEELEHREVHDDSNYAPPHKIRICTEPPETGLYTARTIIKPSQCGWTVFTARLRLSLLLFLGIPFRATPGTCREVTRVLKSKDIILPVSSCIPIIYQEYIISLQSKEKKIHLITMRLIVSL